MKLFVFSTVSFKLIPSGADLTAAGLEVYPAAQVSAVITRLSCSTGETYSWARPYAGVFLWAPLLCFLQLSTLIWLFDECNGKNALVLCNGPVFIAFELKRTFCFSFSILESLHYFCVSLLKWSNVILTAVINTSVQQKWSFYCL